MDIISYYLTPHISHACKDRGLVKMYLVSPSASSKFSKVKWGIPILFVMSSASIPTFRLEFKNFTQAASSRDDHYLFWRFKNISFFIFIDQIICIIVVLKVLKGRVYVFWHRVKISLTPVSNSFSWANPWWLHRAKLQPWQRIRDKHYH